ncbi:heterokaryon incompatibility protein-domain-containing protein, partial [Phaeosphaeriaceae sp. PMI808]
MLEYRYFQLSLPTYIRLLRLLPCGQDTKTLRCELFEYPIQNSNTLSHPYEALSYVWGSEDKPWSIIIDNQNLSVTQNLYTALLRLQNHTCPRIIWVDAVCIDQANEKEKESQISLMVEIYAKASRVVVWLGEAEGDGDRALEVIRLTGEKSARPSDTKELQQAIQKLLQRPWFQRIWVLQEMAAARHVSIMCGSTEIDGHAFCSGLDVSNTLLEDTTTPVAFLVRGAAFRSRTMSQKQRRFSLDICSLSELVDKYHAQKATRLHDKVYALLGMCQDDLSKAGLEPNYTLKWGELMQRLVKFLLGDNVSINTWDNKETAVLKGKGCILGRVSKVEANVSLGIGQTLEAIFENKSKQFRHRNGSTHWTLPTSAKSIQEGDIICLLQGASNPTIVRLCEDHFRVVMIEAILPEYFETEDDVVNLSELLQSAPFTRDFLLVWSWE